jgi:hypothetical protein
MKNLLSMTKKELMETIIEKNRIIEGWIKENKELHKIISEWKKQKTTDPPNSNVALTIRILEEYENTGDIEVIEAAAALLRGDSLTEYIRNTLIMDDE